MSTLPSPDDEPPPVPTDLDDRRDSGEEGVAPIAQVGSLLFAELVHAHYVWDTERRGGNDDRAAELRQAFDEKLAAFCRAEGGILGAYWCTIEASAVILTQGSQTRWQRLIGEHPLRLHRVTNWLMPRSAHRLVGVLRDCDELALLASEILRGTPRRIGMRWAFELESELLAFLERTRGRPSEHEIAEFATDARARIARARADYDNAADKIARMVYVSGMVAGIALLVPIAVLAAVAIGIFGALDLHAPATQAFFACMAAGALGALVSVLSRMGSPGKFGLDPCVGRRSNFFLGIFRPFVGSIFGLALYFLLQSSLVQASTGNKFATYIVVAFMGGFSERFVKVMLQNAEGAAGGSADAGTAKGST